MKLVVFIFEIDFQFYFMTWIQRFKYIPIFFFFFFLHFCFYLVVHMYCICTYLCFSILLYSFGISKYVNCTYVSVFVKVCAFLRSQHFYKCPFLAFFIPNMCASFFLWLTQCANSFMSAIEVWARPSASWVHSLVLLMMHHRVLRGRECMICTL